MSARSLFTRLAALSLLAGVSATALHGQDMPKVGDIAPDFTLPGATRAGVTSAPIHLADLKGQTVVLAFFPKARTKG